MSLYENIQDIFNSNEEDRERLITSFFDAEYNRERIQRWYSNEEVWDKFHEKIDELNLIINLSDQRGGEGQGEEYWSVYEFSSPEETVYIKFNGYYQSYEGATFTEFFEVFPKQKTITVYEQTYVKV